MWMKVRTFSFSLVRKQFTEIFLFPPVVFRLFDLDDFPKLKIFATNHHDTRGLPLPARRIFYPAVWAIETRTSLLGNYLTHIGLPEDLNGLRSNINSLPQRLRPDGCLLPFIQLGVCQNVNSLFLQHLVQLGANPFATCYVQVGNLSIDTNLFGLALLQTHGDAFERIFKHISPGESQTFFEFCVHHEEARGGAISVCPRGFASILHVIPKLGRQCTLNDFRYIRLICQFILIFLLNFRS